MSKKSKPIDTRAAVRPDKRGDRARDALRKIARPKQPTVKRDSRGRRTRREPS